MLRCERISEHRDLPLVCNVDGFEMSDSLQVLCVVCVRALMRQLALLLAADHVQELCNIISTQELRRGPLAMMQAFHWINDACTVCRLWNRRAKHRQQKALCTHKTMGSAYWLCVHKNLANHSKARVVGTQWC
mmetsp:Transcript_36591/g.77116  ORF Transcript_36591/g.77116 Transcript_36591/m.77116 type:complete len:133 (+) Transcript_36591:971-1369(+)